MRLRRNGIGEKQTLLGAIAEGHPLETERIITHRRAAAQFVLT